jgi:hypothetical protein
MRHPGWPILAILFFARVGPLLAGLLSFSFNSPRYTWRATRLNSVFHLGINSLQRLLRSFDEADYGTAIELRLRRRLCPDLARLINCDVIPYDARAIMFSHGMGENSI